MSERARGAPGRRPRLRGSLRYSFSRILILVAVAHVLILAGAFLVIQAIAAGSASLDFGSVLLAGGVAMEVLAITWSALLVGGSSVPPSSLSSQSPLGPTRPDAHWLCTGCGLVSRGRVVVCARCGKLAARLPS